MLLSISYFFILSFFFASWHISRFIAAGRKHKRLARKNGCQLPPHLPQWDKLLGSDIILEDYQTFRNNTYLSMMKKRFELCGRTWACTIMGETRLATIHIENIKRIFVTEPQFYGLGSGRVSVLGMVLGHGVFTTDGDEWQSLRRMSRPGFDPSQVNIEPYIQNLIAQIPDDGSHVNLQPLFHNMVVYSSSSILWGEHAVNLLDSQGQSFSRRMNGAISEMFDFARQAMVFGPLTKFMQSASTKNAFKLTYDIILNNSKRSFTLQGTSTKPQGSKYGAVAELYSDIFGAHRFDAAHMQMRHMFIASEGTTSEALTSLFHLLSRHRCVFEKLRSEILSKFPRGTMPSTSCLNKLAYLDACIKEALRLFPPAPINSRIALKDTLLPRGGGPDGLAPIAVQAGTQIFIQHYPLHRCKDIFGEDADEFVPERWLPPADDKKTQTLTWQMENLISFSLGKRVCPGKTMALKTMKYATVRLLQEFSDINDASGRTPWQEKCGVTMQSKHGAVVTMNRAPVS